jgi:hypothetical protein
MLKRILTGSFICALVVATGLSAKAQTPKPEEQPAPQGQSQTSPQPQTSPQAQVSTQEVEQFANAIKQLRTIQEQAQNQADQAIQAQGLTVDRFNEILQTQRGAEGSQGSQSQPSSGSSNARVSSEEQQNFNQALSKVSEIQQTTQQQMEQAVQKEGLSIQRFNQIFAAVRQSPDLRQQVEQKLQGGTSQSQPSGSGSGSSSSGN